MNNLYESQYEEDEILSQWQKDIGKQVSLQLDTNPEPSIKKKSRISKVALIVLSVFCILGITVFTMGNYTLDRINYESDDDVTKVVEDAGAAVANAKEIDLPNSSDFVGSDKNVINILLIGEEAMADNRGRSDVMIVATINQDQNTLKLTSFMRDTYVAIPGYKNNKLNAAFNNGGGPLLCDTIELNFNIKIDGYVRVDFDGFESVIDKLGGVELTLTQTEANYLNRTNYISDKKNRDVVAGKQTLNGNQALGYSRVRYVSSITEERDDFGRTSRQRIVLNAIFNKYKSKNIIELASIANDILPLVTTNMKKAEILSYLTSAATLGATKLETLRIPIDNGYSPEEFCLGSSTKKSSVLVPNLEINNEELSKFIYGQAD